MAKTSVRSWSIRGKGEVNRRESANRENRESRAGWNGRGKKKRTYLNGWFESMIFDQSLIDIEIETTYICKSNGVRKDGRQRRRSIHGEGEINRRESAEIGERGKKKKKEEEKKLFEWMIPNRWFLTINWYWNRNHVYKSNSVKRWAKTSIRN